MRGKLELMGVPMIAKNKRLKELEKQIEKVGQGTRVSFPYDIQAVAKVAVEGVGVGV